MGANLVVFELEEATERSELERVFRGLAKRVIERQAARTSPVTFGLLFGHSKSNNERLCACLCTSPELAIDRQRDLRDWPLKKDNERLWECLCEGPEKLAAVFSF